MTQEELEWEEFCEWAEDEPKHIFNRFESWHEPLLDSEKSRLDLMIDAEDDCFYYA